jgi:ribose/xylose/arabinose/galactoside ABC-type transport system permease subunit
MTGPLVAGFVWVIAGAVTAMLPMRLQYPPGILLLIAAPLLILWIGMVHGWIVGVLCLAAFLSMFRRPLVYFWRKARGLPVERPEDVAP